MSLGRGVKSGVVKGFYAVSFLFSPRVNIFKWREKERNCDKENRLKRIINEKKEQGGKTQEKIAKGSNGGVGRAEPRERQNFKEGGPQRVEMLRGRLGAAR